MMFLKLVVMFVSALQVFSHAPPGADIQIPSGTTLLKTGPFGSKLFKFNVEGSVYQDAPMLVDLTAKTLYQQGFDNGFLLGAEYKKNYENLMTSLIGDNPLITRLVSEFVDWQWNHYLKVQVPDEYIQELEGMTAGAHAAGLKVDIGAYAGRGITLANLPGKLTNFKYILMDEAANPALADLQKLNMSPDDVDKILVELSKRWAGLTCSMFGTWGSRTDGGKLFTGRNLDWLKDTGISTYKLITVHHPPGAYAHATFGWAGIWGSITGMSSQGITAHEANLESDDITWRGFPWIVRLRHVMAHSKNLEEALAIWAQTNNTVGFNHGFGSANDGRAVVLETMMHNTAVFESNDVREQSQIVDGVEIGAPRTEAVYRTNHGYDAYTKAHYIQRNYNDSINRYMLFPAMFDNYQAIGTKITHVEAINITAVVGHKNKDNFYQCVAPYDNGSNILSVTYDPAELIAYAAWENHDAVDGWVPAACNTYLKISLKEWLL